MDIVEHLRITKTMSQFDTLADLHETLVTDRLNAADEIESLRQQLAHAETNVAAQAEMLEKVIRERDEYLRDLGAMKNWIADWHKKDTELATVTAERDELVVALGRIASSRVVDIAQAALAKLGADKTGEKTPQVDAHWPKIRMDISECVCGTCELGAKNCDVDLDGHCGGAK